MKQLVTPRRETIGKAYDARGLRATRRTLEYQSFRSAPAAVWVGAASTAMSALSGRQLGRGPAADPVLALATSMIGICQGSMQSRAKVTKAIVANPLSQAMRHSGDASAEVCVKARAVSGQKFRNDVIASASQHRNFVSILHTEIADAAHVHQRAL